MGTVFLARESRLDRVVALKVLPSEFGDDESFRKRFIRESRAALALEHPNIVPVYDAGESEGQLYIAMRHVQGSDLRHVLRVTPRLPIDQAVDLVAQIARALDAAHSRGLVHRDVKPENILVAPSSDGGTHFYLADFGLTKKLQSASVTVTGQFVGTIAYSAPEQFDGQADGRADQYSLACVLYECLAGSLPFPHTSEVQLIYAHLHSEPPPVTTYRPGLDHGIDRVLTRAISKRPEDRFDSCGTFATQVRRVLTEAGASSAPAATNPSPDIRTHPPDVTVVRARPGRFTGGRLRRFALVIAAGLALATAASVPLLVGRGQKPSTHPPNPPSGSTVVPPSAPPFATEDFASGKLTVTFPSADWHLAAGADNKQPQHYLDSPVFKAPGSQEARTRPSPYLQFADSFGHYFRVSYVVAPAGEPLREDGDTQVLLALSSQLTGADQIYRVEAPPPTEPCPAGCSVTTEFLARIPDPTKRFIEGFAIEFQCGWDAGQAKLRGAESKTRNVALLPMCQQLIENSTLAGVSAP